VNIQVDVTRNGVALVNTTVTVANTTPSGSLSFDNANQLPAPNSDDRTAAIRFDGVR
jgi:hypothetical protein